MNNPAGRDPSTAAQHDVFGKLRGAKPTHAFTEPIGAPTETTRVTSTESPVTYEIFRDTRTGV